MVFNKSNSHSILYIQNLNGWNQEYLHLFAVFFNKILIKYIFGIFEDSGL